VSLRDFLREKLIFLAIVLFTAVITVLLITKVFMVDTLFTILAASILVVGSLFALVPEYLIKHQYYQSLKDTLAHLEKKFLLSDVLEYPEFEEGKILYETLRTANKSMNDELARSAAASLEYREYIELWVHEIKTPIAGLKLMSENIHDRELLAELDRVEFLVEQVLFYARSSTVEKDYQIRQVRLDEIVGSALKSSSRLLIAHRVKVRTVGLERRVLTDTKWMVFILRQLLENSIKYGASNLEFFADQHERGEVLLVRDDGVGIEEKDLGRIFDKGFTGEQGRRFGKATGMGLYLCQKLCFKLGLGISAQSTPGEGTAMEIVFPNRNPFT
jgi:signal transduction histidine kinase